MDTKGKKEELVARLAAVETSEMTKSDAPEATSEAPVVDQAVEAVDDATNNEAVAEVVAEVVDTEEGAEEVRLNTQYGTSSEVPDYGGCHVHMEYGDKCS